MCQMQGWPVKNQWWVIAGVCGREWRSVWGEEMSKWVKKNTAGELQHVDVFNELNWFMGLAYFLWAASARCTFTYSWRRQREQLGCASARFMFWQTRGSNRRLENWQYQRFNIVHSPLRQCLQPGNKLHQNEKSLEFFGGMVNHRVRDENYWYCGKFNDRLQNSSRSKTGIWTHCK